MAVAPTIAMEIKVMVFSSSDSTNVYWCTFLANPTSLGSLVQREFAISLRLHPICTLVGLKHQISLVVLSPRFSTLGSLPYSTNVYWCTFLANPMSLGSLVQREFAISLRLHPICTLVGLKHRISLVVLSPRFSTLGSLPYSTNVYWCCPSVIQQAWDHWCIAEHNTISHSILCSLVGDKH